MSGIEGVGSTTVTTTTGEISLPPPTARPEAHEHGGVDLAWDVVVHDGAEAVAYAAETAGAGTFGLATGAVVGAAGWAYGLMTMAGATLRSGVEGTRDGAVYAALGGDGSPTSRAYGAGMAACMLGASSRELASMRDALPLSLRDDFAAGVENAHQAASSEPAGWMEARAEYRAIFRDFSDGQAAALGGWDDPGRGEVFARSRAAAAEALEANPRAGELRASYHAHVRDGFVDADAGHVDSQRFTLDAAYRAGVTHHRHEAARGEAALDTARASIVGFTAGSALHAPISG